MKKYIIPEIEFVMIYADETIAAGSLGNTSVHFEEDNEDFED